MIIFVGNVAGLVALCFLFGCYVGFRGIDSPSMYSSGDEFLMWCQHVYEMNKMATYVETAMFMLIIIILLVDVGYYILHSKGY